MTTLHAKVALLPGGLTEDVRVTFEGTRITDVAAGACASAGDERTGLLLPGIASLHSHAFQRAMAGLAETRGGRPDSFWTWREAMYRLALAMTPDQMQAIAAQLYVEMLEAGFTRVGEFHYLHHGPDGGQYGDIAEMAGRICAATAESGIELTLLPVFYAHSTFGDSPPLAEQRRFINSPDEFGRLLDGCRRHAGRIDEANVGLAPHSLRAVTPQELDLVTKLADGPIHIHAAEQMREVEDCIAWSGRRPVEWLLDNAALDARWCLVHATHMTESETRALARCGATAGVCPITEANLGDGIFNGRTFLAAGGAIGIGTDSNIHIGVADELRQLEYSQRLAVQGRNVLSDGQGSTGRALYQTAFGGGARALGIEVAGLVPGARASLVSIDLDGPAFAAASPQQLLDVWIFAGRAAIDRVWVGGRKLVDGGRHVHHDAVAKRFVHVMRELAAA